MLTDARDTIEIAQGARYLGLPVKANTTIYQGSIVALDATGMAVPGSKAAGLTAAGRAEETVKNTGADGDATIRVKRGVFVYGNSATNPVTAAELLKECYLEDDCTVSSSADGSSVAGKVIRVDPDGIAVEIG